MVVLVYNIGTTAFANSTVLRELNSGDRIEVAEAFLLWDKIRLDGQPVSNSYLKKHRNKERTMFLKPISWSSQTIKRHKYVEPFPIK